MAEERTKISVSKTINISLNVLCAKLGIRKVELLEKLGNVPVEALKELLEKNGLWQ